MPALSPSFMRNVRSRNSFAWYLCCCFASVALTALAQSQAPGQNPVTNAPVAIPPDIQVQPQPRFQPQPSTDLWDRWGIQKVSENDDWTHHFRIGAMVGLNISANFSMKGKFNIPGNNAANGIYDDGYVRVDDTGNAQGYTSYWGYHNQNQLAGSTLTMDSTTSYTTSGSSQESGSAFPGFDMAYGGNLWDWGRARIGWELGFGLLPISITDNSSMSAQVNQTVYTFNTGTITVPSAPYSGPINSAGNPTIFSNITSTNNTVTGENITGSHSLDVMLYTVRLGPSVYWDLNEDFGLSAGAGPAVGIVSGNLKYNDVINGTSVSNKGQIDGTDVVYGGYVNASLIYHLEENGDLYLGVQYMSLGKANISGGGRQGQLNLGGQVYITAGINWPF
jgi:hypothetical protein